MKVTQVFRLVCRRSNNGSVFAKFNKDFDHYPLKDEIIEFSEEVKKKEKYGSSDFIVERIHTVIK